MTSNEWASPFGVFQVYCLQGTGQGLKDGTLHVGPPELLFDGDFQAKRHFDQTATIRPMIPSRSEIAIREAARMNNLVANYVQI